MIARVTDFCFREIAPRDCAKNLNTIRPVMKRFNKIQGIDLI